MATRVRHKSSLEMVDKLVSQTNCQRKNKFMKKFLSFDRPLAFYILTETLSLDVIQLARAKWGKRTSAVGRELARLWLIWRCWFVKSRTLQFVSMIPKGGKRYREIPQEYR